MTDLKRILDAQATLKAQFDEHECDLNGARAKWQGSSESAVWRTVYGSPPKWDRSETTLKAKESPQPDLSRPLKPTSSLLLSSLKLFGFAYLEAQANTDERSGVYPILKQW